MSRKILRMRVVSNTSPISGLAIIGRLEALRTQFGVIQIPETVRDELLCLEHSAARLAIHRAQAAGWINIASVKNKALVSALNVTLDAGEAAAIALAVAADADFLIMDESTGRATARNLGLTITGTLGVLLKEKRAGRIPSLNVEMKRLMDEAGFFLSDSIYEQFRSAAGEDEF